MKLKLDLEHFLDERRFNLEAQKLSRARLLRAVERPTRVSVGGKEFAVRDGVLDVPPELAEVLLAQGWRKTADESRAPSQGKNQDKAGG